MTVHSIQNERDVRNCAMLLDAHDAAGDDARSFAILKNAGFATPFIASRWDEIVERAREMRSGEHYSRHVVFLNARPFQPLGEAAAKVVEDLAKRGRT